jgi:signal recognition particle receptor subunit beta
VAVNGFHGDFPHEVGDVQEALSVSAHVPVVQCDARDRRSTKSALISLVQHAMTMQASPRAAAGAHPGPTRVPIGQG